MPCYSPLVAYKSKYVNESGKRSLVFNIKHALDDEKQQVPCGQCIGCRLERSRQWAIRCTHEASLYERSCFITLTYNDANLPSDGSLKKDHFQKFMKRFRKRFQGYQEIEYYDSKSQLQRKRPIRYYMCGEYGDLYSRPHYHACIFNFDFPDKVFWKKRLDSRLYVSKALEELWPYGYSVVGDVTFQSAAYVARYIMKKVNGSKALHHYSDIDYSTGEVVNERIPEYNDMSRRPGIGRLWFDRFKDDVFPHDYVVLNGRKMKPPKYYDSLLEKEDGFLFDEIKDDRYYKALKHIDNNSYQRLDVREAVQEARLKLLIRNVE